MKAAVVAATVDNRKARAEAVRIAWRRWVMETGGVEWLRAFVRTGFGKGMRERDMGPHNLTWPPSPSAPSTGS